MIHAKSWDEIATLSQYLNNVSYVLKVLVFLIASNSKPTLPVLVYLPNLTFLPLYLETFHHLVQSFIGVYKADRILSKKNIHFTEEFVL